MPGIRLFCFSRAACELYQQGTERPAHHPFYLSIGRSVLGVKEPRLRSVTMAGGLCVRFMCRAKSACSERRTPAAVGLIVYWINENITLDLARAVEP